MTVFINTNRFGEGPQYANSATYELAFPTDVTDELLEWCLRGLEKIFLAGYRYKKAGVILNHLRPSDQLTVRLFGAVGYERSRRVMKAVDEINSRHGRDTVRFGVADPAGRWKTKALRRSRQYTTRLSEVLNIA